MEGRPAGVLVGICSDVDFIGVYLRGTPVQGKMASTRTVGPGNAGIVFRGLATGAASYPARGSGCVKIAALQPGRE